VANIDKAKAAGGHLEYDPYATITALALAPAPTAAQEFVNVLSGERPQYAIVATARGPLAAYIVDASGKKTQLGTPISAQTAFRQAYFGQYRDTAIGPIWFQLAYGDCGSGWMAGTCNV
jgi:hypothetical protein